LRNHEELGHRQIRFAREPLHYFVESRRLFTADGHSAARHERDLIGEEISGAVHEHGKNQSQLEAVASAESFTHEEQQQRERGQ